MDKPFSIVWEKEQEDLQKKRDELLKQISERAGKRNGQSICEIIWDIRYLCNKLEDTCKMTRYNQE